MRIFSLGLLPIAVVMLVGARTSYPQSAGQHARSHQQTTSPQTSNQVLNVGDKIQIQAGDGTWINGTVQNFDQASGKYGLALENGMTGTAPGSSLRKISASTPGQGEAPSSAGAPASSGVQAAAGGVCGTQPACQEVREFAAVITEFRMSSSASWKIVDVGIRFINKTDQPLGIGYLSGSGGVIDDQGNRFTLRDEGSIRGIGVVRPGNVDSKFILQPGENKDTRFEFVFNPGQSVVGTSFEVDLTARILNAAGGGQYTLGAEYPLQFQGLGQTVVSTVQSAANGVPPGGVSSTGQAFAQGGGDASAGAAGTQSATGTGAQSSAGQGGLLGGLSKAAGMIPGGLGGRGGTVLNQVQTLGSTLGTGGSLSGMASQAAAAIPGFTQTGSTGNGTGATGTAAGVASQVSAAIPGFTPAQTSGAQSQPGTAMAAGGLVNAGAGGNPCIGKASCFNAGSFAASVTQLAGNVSASQYVMQLQMSFRNVSAGPVTLAYIPGSAMATDNLGNRYQAARTGATDTSVSGMGQIQSGQASSNFAIAPGQTRTAAFRLVRNNATAAVGSSFNVSVAVAELDMSTGQPRMLRQDRVSLSGLACTGCGAVAKPTAVAATKTSATPSSSNPLGNLLKKTH